MNLWLSRFRNFGLLAVLLAGLIGCQFGGNTGQLSMSLTDAGTDLYQAVYVTVKEIDVHRADDAAESWTAVATPNRTYNLLALRNGVREQLGLVNLDAGHYTQMRFIIGEERDSGLNILSQAHPFANYVIDDSGQSQELKVASGMQTGIKIIHGFDINENQTTELILDFDALKSVVVAGRSGKFLLKPTIKVLSETLASIINGSVTQASDQSALEGAVVMAQVFDAAATDIKDQVIVQASTLSDEAGSYTLFVMPGAYNLVAGKTGFAPSAVAINAEADQTLTQDFSLAVADSGTVEGTATIVGGASETFVTISFRQTVSLGGSDVAIEVLSVNVANGETYSVSLPVGLYSAVSSTAGKPTQQAEITVVKDETLTLDVSF